MGKHRSYEMKKSSQANSETQKTTAKVCGVDAQILLFVRVILVSLSLLFLSPIRLDLGYRSEDDWILRWRIRPKALP